MAGSHQRLLYCYITTAKIYYWQVCWKCDLPGLLAPAVTTMFFCCQIKQTVGSMDIVILYSISNRFSARLYAILQDSRLEQDIHKLFTPSDRQFNTLGVHNVPAPQVLAFFSSIQPKTQCMASIIDHQRRLSFTC